MTPPPGCVRCGVRIGIYEPVVRLAADGRARTTSWLQLSSHERAAAAGKLWHAECAQAAGLSP